MTTSDDTKIQGATTADTAKLVVAALFVVAGVIGYYLLSGQAAWLRWAPVVGGLVLAAIVVALSRYGTALKQFMADSRIELRKIVWPNRNETGMTTLVVFVFLLIAGVFFWGLDLVLAWATRAITSPGGG